MKKAIFILLLLFSFSYSNAQSPGNVGTGNLTAWFTLDSMPDGSAMNWKTTYPSGGSALTLIESSSPYPQVTGTPSGSIANYQKVMDFDGNIVGAEQVLELSSALDLLDNSFSSDEGTFFGVYYLPKTRVCDGCHIVTYRESSFGSGDGIQFRVKLGSGTGRIAIGSGASSNGSADWTQDFLPDIISYKGNKSGIGTMSAYRRSSIFSGGVASASTGDQGLFVGARRSGGTTYNAPYDGYLYELIFFDKDLSATELVKVHSYIGVKFGITLDNTGGGAQGDYLSTTGGLIWDASDNPGYHHDVIGIGRDENQRLYQKQSHSFGDSQRIYIDSLQLTNADNAGMITNDSSYIMIGHDNGQLCATVASNLEIPSGSTIFERIEREWKVSNTNFLDPYQFELMITSCIDTTALDTSDLRLLVDDDGDFTDATVFSSSSGLSFSADGGFLTISGIDPSHIPMDSTVYMTLGSGSMITEIDPEESLHALKLYPNPAGSSLFIEGMSGNQSEILLTDMLGRSYPLTFRTASDGKITVIDLSEFIPGVYLLRIDAGVHRIIIQ